MFLIKQLCIYVILTLGAFEWFLQVSAKLEFFVSQPFLRCIIGDITYVTIVGG
jgi:hypothetical protein